MGLVRVQGVELGVLDRLDLGRLRHGAVQQHVQQPVGQRLATGQLPVDRVPLADRHDLVWIVGGRRLRAELREPRRRLRAVASRPRGTERLPRR